MLTIKIGTQSTNVEKLISIELTLVQDIKSVVTILSMDSCGCISQGVRVALLTLSFLLRII